jgi:hypothetical protein
MTRQQFLADLQIMKGQMWIALLTLHLVKLPIETYDKYNDLPSMLSYQPHLTKSMVMYVYDLIEQDIEVEAIKMLLELAK